MAPDSRVILSEKFYPVPDERAGEVGRPLRLRRLWIQWILILGEVAAAELRLIPSLIPGRDKGAAALPMESVQLGAVGQ